MEGLLFRGHPEVIDADLADYFGSIPHAELLQSVASPSIVPHGADHDTYLVLERSEPI